MSQSIKMQAVFIFGMPKSGTTLLTALLDSHPDVLVFPVESRYYTPQFQAAWKHASTVSDVVDAVFTVSGFSTFNPNVASHKKDVFGRRPAYVDRIPYEVFRNGLTAELEGVGTMTMGNLFLATARALAPILGYEKLPRYYLEKTPYNEFHQRAIEMDVPRSTLLHVMRDPYDNFASFKLWLEQKAHVYSTQFILDWRHSRTIAENNKRRKRALLVQYEDLVADPKKEMQQVAAHLDVPFQDSMLTPTLAGVPWKGNSSDGKQFSGIAKSQVKRSLGVLTDAERVLVGAYCTDERVSPLAVAQALTTLPFKEQIRLTLGALFPISGHRR
jgi:hypothetical protein